MRHTLLLVSFLAVVGSAQDYPSPGFGPTGSVAELDAAGSVLMNPAGLSISRQLNSQFLVPVDFNSLDSSGKAFSLTLQSGTSGLGYTYRTTGRDYFHFGGGGSMDYGVAVGFMSHLSRRGYEALDLGLLWRATNWLSSGLAWKNIYSRDRFDQALTAGIAWRPFGNRFTLSYDQRYLAEASGAVSGRGGLILMNTEFLDGLGLQAGYDTESKGITLSLSFGFGHGNIEAYMNPDRAGTPFATGALGFSTSTGRRRSLTQSRHPRFVTLKFEAGIEDSPGPVIFFGGRTVTLRRAILAIDELAQDPDVDGIIINPEQLSLGFGQLQEFRAALVRFRQAGKKLFVFADYLSDAQYATVAMADGIYINSGGALMMDGIAMIVDFWKGTLDKLGLQAQFYRRGKYKSAAETYSEEHMTEPSRIARQAVLDDINTTFLDWLKQRPGMTTERLETVFERAVFTGQQALEYGLVDDVYHPDQKDARIKSIIGADKISTTKSDAWLKKWTYDWEKGLAPKIALIYAEGPIVPGRSQPSPFRGGKQVGSETTARAIREARENSSVKAIVLRVNSPGGSVLASEDIWREVHRTTHPDSADEKHRKPVFVSMGNVAASGGYYISCAADTIVADSACITGSIGVLTVKLSAAALLKKIGLNFDVLQTQPHADMFSIHRALTDYEGSTIQDLVDSYYEQFLERVAEGRGMTREQVDSLAQGRIWSGQQAREIGLVDVLGGLQETLALARSRIGLQPDEKVELVIYSTFDKFSLELASETGSVLSRELEKLVPGQSLTEVLDRIVLLSLEPALYLMEEVISID